MQRQKLKILKINFPRFKSSQNADPEPLHLSLLAEHIGLEPFELITDLSKCITTEAK